MSDIAIGRTTRRKPFGAAAIALLIGLGVIGFIFLLVLAAYAPERRGLDNGRGNALSNSAPGFQGIVRLARATGREPVLVRNDRQWDADGLLVVIPESGYVDLGQSIDRAQPTLVVFPKWQISALEDRDGWVSTPGPLDAEDPQMVLAPGYHYEIERRDLEGQALSVSPQLPQSVRFKAPDQLQVILRDRFAPPDDEEDIGAGESVAPVDRVFDPLITDGRGGLVLGRIGSLYVLSDPDLLNNIGMADADNARAALALLDALQALGQDGPVDGLMFDVTLNGFASVPSPLRLMFEPPFLAMTLALSVLIAMVGARAFGRFGEPARSQRALAFGKAALADSSAALLRKAGRTHRLGGRYADAMRVQARRMFAIPTQLRGAELDAYLDRLDRRTDFTTLAARAETAGDEAQLLSAARALNDWKQETVS